MIEFKNIMYTDNVLTVTDSVQNNSDQLKTDSSGSKINVKKRVSQIIKIGKRGSVEQQSLPSRARSAASGYNQIDNIGIERNNNQLKDYSSNLVKIIANMSSFTNKLPEQEMVDTNQSVNDDKMSLVKDNAYQIGEEYRNKYYEKKSILAKRRSRNHLYE